MINSLNFGYVEEMNYWAQSFFSLAKQRKLETLPTIDS